ncbi:MAG: GntR family transcriptional regulator [Gammaproteobacteria bacterium]|nr:MAG: GntR family transcriptional regulator [Gammaproteobacteria bacterium]
MELEANQTAAVADGDRAKRVVLYEEIYKQLFQDLITGQLEPERTLTVRGLAKQLEVSPMPVREAVKRLVAQGALEITATRRISVASMSPERFDEIVLARTLLEPELAARALPNMSEADVEQAHAWDEALNRAIEQGDPGAYGRNNWGFHSFIYQQAELPTLYGLVESLWLQVAPFMRQIVGRSGTRNLEDQHALALRAIRTGNETLLRQAIRQDILDGQMLVRDQA